MVWVFFSIITQFLYYTIRHMWQHYPLVRWVAGWLWLFHWIAIVVFVVVEFQLLLLVGSMTTSREHNVLLNDSLKVWTVCCLSKYVMRKPQDSLLGLLCFRRLRCFCFAIFFLPVKYSHCDNNKSTLECDGYRRQPPAGKSQANTYTCKYDYNKRGKRLFAE